MRAMFGLVSLLVMIGIMTLIFKNVEAPTLEQGKRTEDQARRVSGRGEDGRSALDSFKTAPQVQGSKLKSLLVTEVTAGGAVEQYYGLKKGDEITSITTQAGLQKINEASNDDPTMAKDLVMQAFKESMPIVVVRDGKTLMLPPTDARAAAAPAQAQKPQPPRSVYDQLNNIQKSVSGQ